MVVAPVSPLLQRYEIVPSTSSSARVFEAVRISSSVGVPEIVTEPVGLSLTLSTSESAVSVIVLDSLSSSV